MQNGKNRIRLMPPKDGRKLPFELIWEHAYTNDEGVFLSVPCARLISKGKSKCPACEESQRRLDGDQPNSRVDGNEMRAKQRAYGYVINRDNEEAGVMLVAFPKTVYDILIDYIGDEDDPCDISDVLEGFDVVVTRTGSGKFDTEYSTKLAPKPSRLHPTDDQINSWVESSPNLMERAVVLRAEEISNMMAGLRKDGEPWKGDGKSGTRRAAGPPARDDHRAKGRAGRNDVIDVEPAEDEDDDELPDGV
jgi:hypothetical protein